MDCLFKRAFGLAVLLLVAAVITPGCVSYRLTKVEVGQSVARNTADRLTPGETTLDQALRLLGAPDLVIGLGEQNLLIYRRSISYENSVSVSIPLTDFVVLNSADVSASGGLVRFDILALFFTPQGMLKQFVLEQGSDAPYFKTLFKD